MIKVNSLISLLSKNNANFFTGVPDSVLKELSQYLLNKKKKIILSQQMRGLLFHWVSVTILQQKIRLAFICKILVSLMP